MTKEQIKAEHDRLRPIVFKMVDCEYVCMNRNGQWVGFDDKPNIDEMSQSWGLGSGETFPTLQTVRSFWLTNSPETTLDWNDTLIERGDERLKKRY